MILPPLIFLASTISVYLCLPISVKHFFQVCMQQLEADMEHAFAMAKSKDKTCGICMEVVVEKQKSEARNQRYKSFGDPNLEVGSVNVVKC